MWVAALWAVVAGVCVAVGNVNGVALAGFAAGLCVGWATGGGHG